MKNGEASQYPTRPRLGREIWDKTYKTKHPDRIALANRKYRAKPEKLLLLQNSALQRFYGISLETYNALLESQGGVCAICKRPELITHKGNPVKLAVDHCHTTGKVRGLLCRHCNVALGLLGESPDRIRTLAAYIERFLDPETA